MAKKDFGKGYLVFCPSVNGKTEDDLYLENSQVSIDGWFTATQLRNIADELERLESEMKKRANKRLHTDAAKSSAKSDPFKYVSVSGKQKSKPRRAGKA